LKLIITARTGQRLVLFTGSGVDQSDGSAMQCSAGLIGDVADHRSKERLAEKRCSRYRSVRDEYRETNS
jgi:hypothetical protein